MGKNCLNSFETQDENETDYTSFEERDDTDYASSPISLQKNVGPKERSKDTDLQNLGTAFLKRIYTYRIDKNFYPFSIFMKILLVPALMTHGLAMSIDAPLAAMPQICGAFCSFLFLFSFLFVYLLFLL